MFLRPLSMPTKPCGSLQHRDVLLQPRRTRLENPPLAVGHVAARPTQERKHTMTDDATTTRCCPNCHEWYDARANACYLCGTEASEENVALQRAIETTRLNTALSRNVANANAEARADSLFRQARNSGRSYDRPLQGINGYSDLVGSIKRSLEESGM